MVHPLLEVRRLSVTYPSAGGAVAAVRDVSFEIFEGETLALAGETGSGKSTLALAVVDLLDRQTRIEADEILFEGCSVKALDRASWRGILGKKIGIIFQDVRSALNPVLTVENHIVETLRTHQRLSDKQARAQSRALLQEVGIPKGHGKYYPFELSGGISQRVGIAMAICNNPRLIIADEPTSAVDPMIQIRVLDLLMLMKQRHHLALLLISHDLAMVSHVADRICVMYHGRIVETGRREQVLAAPAHPYTQSLMECRPGLQHHHESHRLRAIPGSLPLPGENLPGCAFAPRCSYSQPACQESVPGWMEVSESHQVACINWRTVIERDKGVEG